MSGTRSRVGQPQQGRDVRTLTPVEIWFPPTARSTTTVPINQNPLLHNVYRQ